MLCSDDRDFTEKNLLRQRRKLGEICDEFKSGDFIPASEISKLGTYPVFGGNGLRGFTQRHNHSGEYAIIGRQGALCGNVNYSTGQAYFTEHAIAVRANRNNETRFIFYLLKLLNLGQYSAQSAQPGLAVNKIIALQALLPSKAEQTKVAAILSILDTLITLRRRKCELLETLKKSMLEKLFPKEGELVPELRFAGFTGEWEPLKLEELCVKTTGGGTPSTSMTAYWNGEIPWFQSSDFKDGVVSVSSSNKHISPAGLQKSAAHLIPANSIAIVTRVGFGKLALIPFEYTTSQDLLSLSYLGVDPLFGVYSIYKKLQSELMAVQGTSIKGITKEDLLAKNVLTSRDQDEQQKIGVFLSRIDTLLTLHRRKLELLQNIKKACLEKMFV